MRRLGSDTIELLAQQVAAEETAQREASAPTAAVPTQASSVESGTSTRRGRHSAPVSHTATAPASEWETRYARSLILIDALIALVAGLIAFGVRFGNNQSLPWEYLVASLVLPLAWAGVLLFNRAYERRFLFVGNEEYRRVLNAGVGLTAAVALVAYTGNFEFARGYVVVALPLVTVAGLLGRYLRRKRLFARRRDGDCMRRVVVLGYERPVASLARQLARERYHGMEVVGACLPPDHSSGARIADVELKVYGTFDNVGAAVARRPAPTPWPCCPAPRWTRSRCAGSPGSWSAPVPTWSSRARCWTWPARAPASVRSTACPCCTWSPPS